MHNSEIVLPQLMFVRGIAASPSTHTLYISYRGDGGLHGNGSMLAYDLLTDQVMWMVDFATGIDSMDVTPDGRTIYMPTGEADTGLIWNVVNAANGQVTGTITAGSGPHNTVVGLDGRRVYLGPALL